MRRGVYPPYRLATTATADRPAGLPALGCSAPTSAAGPATAQRVLSGFADGVAGRGGDRLALGRTPVAGLCALPGVLFGSRPWRSTAPGTGRYADGRCRARIHRGTAACRTAASDADPRKGSSGSDG